MKTKYLIFASQDYEKANHKGRRMVLKNLYTGSSGETDIESRLMDMGRGEPRVRCMEKVTWKLTLSYVK